MREFAIPHRDDGFGTLGIVVGARVFVRYLDCERGGIGYCAGTVGFVERDGAPTELVVETDGGARFIPVAKLITVERES